MENKQTKYEMSASEQLIMEYLWEHPEGRLFSEITEHLLTTCDKAWAKQTINTFIIRLTDKNLVRVERNSRQNTYYAAVTEEEFRQGEAQDYLDNFHQGSLFNFISALTGGHNINPATADKLKSFLKDLI